MKQAVIIALAVLAVFAQAASFAFISPDDAAYTFRNPFVVGGLTPANLWEAFTNLRHGGIWMPVTYLTYMLDASICRITGVPLAVWTHGVNVLLHLANAVLVFQLLRRRYDAIAVFLAVLIWAIHPLRAEAVAWVASRKELIWTLFALLALGTWRRGWLWTAAICSLLACMGKPTAMCIPLLIVLADGVGNLRKVPFIAICAMSVATGGIAAYSQTHAAGMDVTSLFSQPLHVRLVNALSAIGYYLRASLLPFGLHIDCRVVDGLPLGWKWNLPVASIVGILIWRFWPRVRLVALWFLLSLLPTLGIFGSFGMEAHADRFAYFPAIAGVVLLAELGSHCALRIVLPVLAIAFGCIAFRQVGFWRNDFVAYSRTLACDAGHPRAMMHLADWHCSRLHDFDGGINFYRQSLSAGLKDVKERLAYALASRGDESDFAEIPVLCAAEADDPARDRRGMILDALGTAAMYHGDFRQAERYFRASLAAPARFWPRGSTQAKLDECKSR